MIPITSLWLPILVSAIFVFIASTVIHMVLKYHDRDFKKVPAEDEVMTALRKLAMREAMSTDDVELDRRIYGELRAVLNRYLSHLLGHEPRMHRFLTAQAT